LEELSVVRKQEKPGSFSRILPPVLANYETRRYRQPIWTIGRRFFPKFFSYATRGRKRFAVLNGVLAGN
jgi:hypothetical protein